MGNRRSEYPRVRWDGSGSEKRKTCRICQCKTRSVICIEYNFMRGDDAVYKVCKGCQKELRSRHADTDVDDILREIDHGGRP